MFCLMVEQKHSAKAAKAAADGSYQKKHCLRDTPEVFLRFDLIHKHKNQTNRIDYKKIEDEELNPHILSFQGGNRMKKRFILFLLAALLTGCKAQETFETVEDLPVVETAAVAQQFFVALPEDAASPTFQSDTEELYVCEAYTISRQIMESGDLKKTIKTLTGKSQDDLEVIQTMQETYDRYDFVWTSAGEEGLQLGRACILDDGNYHYTLTTMTREESFDGVRETVQDMFDSCKLLDPEVNLSTGS